MMLWMYGTWFFGLVKEKLNKTIGRCAHSSSFSLVSTYFFILTWFISPSFSLHSFLLHCHWHHKRQWCVKAHTSISQLLLHLGSFDTILDHRMQKWVTGRFGGDVWGKGDDRGWDGWMASPTRWTWVWVNSGSWWWTGSPGMLWLHNWATELNWTELNRIIGCKNESLGDLGAMLAFPDPNTSSSSLLAPSSCLECKWKLEEQITVGDWTATVQLISGHLVTVVGLPLVSVVSFVLHAVKCSPELTYLFTETLKFYWYIIRFQL